MNSVTSNTFHFLSTQNFPGIPLSDPLLNIQGHLLPSTPNNSIFESIVQFKKEADNLEKYFSFVTCITDKIGKSELIAIKENFPNISHIGNFGVGYNHIDISFASQLGIRVTNSPGVLAEATADIAMTLILCVSRRIGEGYSILNETAHFPGWSPTFLLGTSLKNKNLGIVGFGQIGQALAKRAQAFGLNCYALNHKKTKENLSEKSNNITLLDEDDFFKTVDIVSLNCPLNAQTNNWLNKERIAKIKPTGIVINTARGELIDEEALANALNQNHLFGAGLDVFCNEPVMSEHLKKAKNLFILPHLGSATVETRNAMGSIVFEAIKAHKLEKIGIRPTGLLPYQVN
ncbi:D-glycerate dehydrogenase [Pigmentibacter sp. JX0631]|uniref:2-hydroxyacid dehydrogenase n=1 Tax=Pigmentibacter sp. JX0631 TaxID=2976982 RepID=UPI00246995E0|nr:D-glycerate dehydrogenase [Pigmentibacter sp. JX0631]WGL59010.1 D-glycerate dehydrogenase [Pigmentibacter sp. JX0631]